MPAITGIAVPENARRTWMKLPLAGISTFTSCQSVVPAIVNDTLWASVKSFCSVVRYENSPVLPSAQRNRSVAVTGLVRSRLLRVMNGFGAFVSG